MVQPRVYIDFHNADPEGRLRLNCIGTTRDLARQQVYLAEGLALTLYSDDVDDQGQPAELEVEGVVQYSDSEQGWVASIEWTAIRRVSLRQSSGPNGTAGIDSATPEKGSQQLRS